jgi:hypothetical protein
MTLCTVPNCFNVRSRPRRDGRFPLPWCSHHLRRRKRNGTPTAKYILKKDLYGWRKIVRRYGRQHPERYNEVLSVMRSILEPGPEPRRRYVKPSNRTLGLRWHSWATERRTLESSPTKRRASDPAWALWNELRRLQTGYRPCLGASARPWPTLRSYSLAHDAVEYSTAVFLYFEADPRLDDGARLTTQIGNTILRLAPLRSIRYPKPNPPPQPRYPSTRWATRSYLPPSRAARLLGKRVRERLAGWFVAVNQHVQGEIPNARERQLDQAR